MKVWTSVLLALALATQLAVSPAVGGEQRCSRAHAKRLVKSFVRAHNEGDLRRLDRIFATENFAMYQVGPVERTGLFAQNRATLMDYFEERHSWDDKIELTRFTINTKPNDDGSWGFSYELERSSSQPLPTGSGTFQGKGGANCQLRFWNMSWGP